MNFIKRYLPDTLSRRDRTRQRKELTKSRRLYKQNKYYTRKSVKSFTSKPSKHVDNAQRLYHIQNIRPTRRIIETNRVFIERVAANRPKRGGCLLFIRFAPQPDAAIMGVCAPRKRDHGR